MAGLRTLCADLGWQEVRTHIASGNVVFAAPGPAEDLSAQLERAVAHNMGVQAAVLVLSAGEMRAVLAGCPFYPAAGKQVHAFFCREVPQMDHDALAALSSPGEEVAVRGRTVWLFAPNGIGRSALAANFGKVANGTPMTARNLNTVRTLVEMLD